MKNTRISIFCLVLGVVSLIAACNTSKNLGNFKPDAGVSNSFEKFQINPGYKYFISGSDVYPSSILGLAKKYTLDTDLWKQVDMTPKLLSELVTNMQSRAIQCCGQTMHGFYIFDDKGNKIGVWYSLITGSIVVQMKEDNKVVIFPPRDDLYKRYEDRTDGRMMHRR